MTNTGRYNGKCKACGAKHSRALVADRQMFEIRPNARVMRFVSTAGEVFFSNEFGDIRPIFPCPCGKRIYLREVLGRVAREKTCDGRCMASTGHACECSCGGKNHGAAHG